MPTPDTWPSMPLVHRDLHQLPPLPLVPEGFRLRTWQEGDELTVPLVLANAFDDPEMGLYEAQLKNWHAQPGVTPEGCFVLETTQGLPVATAIGRVDPSEPLLGRLHQMAVRRPYWRRGLGSLTALAALHYIADCGRESAIVGWEWVALLFYLSVGFEPIVGPEELLLEDGDAIPWETSTAWAEVYQLFGQTHSGQAHLLERSAPAMALGTPPPFRRDVWVDDFMVDGDGDLMLTRASIDPVGRRVSFAGGAMGPESFLGALRATSANPEKPVFLRLAQPQPGTFEEDVRSLLWSAGYALCGLVRPRA